MASLNIHETSVGPCVVCDSDSEGSTYWIGMPQTTWLKIRPYIEHLFKPNMVQKTLFIPPYDKPLCGSKCSMLKAV